MARTEWGVELEVVDIVEESWTHGKEDVLKVRLKVSWSLKVSKKVNIVLKVRVKMKVQISRLYDSFWIKWNYNENEGES